MPKIITILGISIMTTLSSAVGASVVSAPAAQVYRLSNGLTVLIQEDKRFPLVSMRLYVHAGSSYEKAEEAGISHLLEHMVFQGTEKRGPGEISSEIEALGGDINAATSFDYTVYTADLPAEHWKVGLDILKDMAFHAGIDESALLSEKQVVIAELKRNEDNPSRFLFTRLQALALRDTVYARPVIGYEQIINSISRQNILDYTAALYQPQSMLLVVVGQVQTELLQSEIEKIYAAIPNSRGDALPPSINPESLPAAGPAIEIRKGPWNKIYLGLAFPTVGQRDSRSAQLDVLAALLGGSNSSYFYRKYKYELRLVDSISLANYSFERLGLLYFSIALDAERFPAFWEEFIADLARINDIRFTDEELARVKLNIEDDLFRAKETISGLADKLGYFAFFSQAEQGEANYLRQLRQTSLDDLPGLLTSVTPQRLSAALLLPEQTENIDETALLRAISAKWPDNAVYTAEDGATSSTGRELIQLGPGRTVILHPDHTLPYISGSLMFTGGDALLDKGEEGLAALTAAVLGKGTSAMTATEVEDYLEDRAALLKAGAGRQSFYFNFTGPSRFNQDIFSLLADTLYRPAFKPEEFARAGQNQSAAIKSAEDQPLGLAFRQLFPFLFGAHPYGFLQLGTVDGLQKHTLDQAKNFWERQKKQAWVLSVCGDFDREALLAFASELPEPATPKISLAAPALREEKELLLSLPERKQSHILLVFPTAPLEDKDTPGLNLLQSVLSGMSGLLFTELRDKRGLGYTVSAIPWQAAKAGLLIFYIGVEPEKSAEAKQGFLDIVSRLRSSPLPEQLLERAKNSLRGDYYRDMQSLAARSNEAATLHTLGLPLDNAVKNLEATANITPEELLALARKYLDPDKARWIVVQP